MITRSNCSQANDAGAFFCKFCGHALACPRCRMILKDPANYCDNCGQILAMGPDKLPDPDWQWERRPSLDSLPEHDLDSSSPAAPSLTSTPSYVDQFLPQELKHKLQAARSSRRLAGERRVVTMLFCDVKGSTAAAERLDPEDWTEIINGAFEYMIKPVYKYEGIVARLMGDAILAFFGAPIAHEDDPQRAVLAGLDIVAGIAPYSEKVLHKWGIDLEFRVGINTGTVVVGAVGSDLRMEYTAMGDAVNLASRMEQMAAPGTVQIAEETFKLVSPYFEIEELGSIAVKGKDQPVPAYRVLRPKALHNRHREFSGASLPLVGRADAVSKMMAAMQKVLQGSGQILFITGEVGFGKSRLLEELHHAWDTAFSDFHEQNGNGLQRYSRWFETFSLSYETTQPYSLFHHFLRQVIGAAQGDPPADLQRKVVDFVTANVPLPEQDEVRAILATLFGLEGKGDTLLEGEAFQRHFYETINSLISQWAEAAPGVIIADDIHWADPASIDLLFHLFGLTDQLPLFFVCTLRPDRTSPAWQLHDKADREYPHRLTEIRLEPLSQDESRRLVSGLLSNNTLPDSLMESILTKTAGNPFFIEEVVRTLIEHGLLIPQQAGAGWEIGPGVDLSEIAIPDSLQSTLMARIDRLDEAQKNVLQMAALIGQSFYYRVLKLLLQELNSDQGAPNGSLIEVLGDLQRMELIVQVARIPELEYVFRQALVQESAYKTILHKQRRKYHLQVGEAMEVLFPDQLEKHAVFLAYHFMHAEAYAKALKYHMMAADTAYRLFAVAEAVEHYTLALGAADGLSSEHEAGTGVGAADDLTHIYLRRGRALELNARIAEAMENYETMRQKAQQIEAREMELAALMATATLYATPTPIYDFDRARSLSQMALHLAQELHDRPAEAKILWNLSNMNRLTGLTEEALDAGERALSIARELDLKEQIAYSLNDLCHLYNRTGQFKKTKAALQETIQLWRDLNNRPMLADSLSTASYVHTFTGNFDDAVAFSQEALAVSESIANNWGISYSQWTIGRVFWERGQPQRAIQVMGDSIHYAEAAGFMVAQVYTRADMALVYGNLGNISEGLTILKEAQSIAENSQRLFMPYVLLHLGRLQLMNGDVEAASKAIAAMRVEDRPVHLNRPEVVTMVECLLPLYQGDPRESVQLFEKRLSELHRFGMRFFLPESYYLLAQALVTVDQLAEAVDSLEQGLQVARSIGSRWSEWQLLLALSNLGVDDQAVALRAQALEIVKLIAGNVTTLELRQSFLNRPDIQGLTEGQAA